MTKGISNATRKLVNERDKGRCWICGANWKPIHLHHIRNRQFRSLIDEPNNLVSLCYECHSMVHQSNRKWQKALLDEMEKRYGICNGTKF